MQLRSSRISMPLQGPPAIVEGSKPQADVRCTACVRLHVRSLPTTLGACLWNLELRIRFDEGIGQLGSKPHVRQIGL